MPITRALRNRLMAGGVAALPATLMTQPPATLGSGANNGTAVDATAHGGRSIAIVSIGAESGTDPTATVVIQQSANGTTGWTTADTFTLISAPNTIARRSFLHTDPHLRSVVTIGGSSTPTMLTSVTIQPDSATPLRASQLWVGVFVNITDNGLDTVLADLTLPTGDVLVRQAVATWGTAYDLADGRRTVGGPLMQFRPADETEGTTVRGWYIADALTSGTLLQWELFPTPHTLVDENSVVSVVPRITIDPDGRWSQFSVYSPPPTLGGGG